MNCFTKGAGRLSLLYVNENGCVIGIEGNQCVVKYPDGMRKIIPIETLEGVTILGNSQMTVQCTQECLMRGIPVSYFSKGGKYFGRLQSTGHINPERQRKQSALYETDFALELSKRIISSKLKNQYVVLRRYERSSNQSIQEFWNAMHRCREKIASCETIQELMGYEGQAAKAYFSGLAKVINPEFAFSGRNKRPPTDEFNSMLSLGYSIVMNEVYSKIEEKGLNPYFGFLHRDRERHPTLASDMMEEWRAVLVDATVMSMINGHEISKDDFIFPMDEPGCYLTKNGIKLYLSKLEKKLQTKVRYLDRIDYAVSFRHAIALQMDCLVNAIQKEDASLYDPIEIR